MDDPVTRAGDDVTEQQRESADFLASLDPETIARLRRMAQANDQRPPVPDTTYGWTRTGHVDHLGLFKSEGTGLWWSRCGRRLQATSLLPVEGRMCSRCIEARDR